MYEIFAKLLKEKGITPYRVHKETGVAQSSLSDWKNGKGTPSAEKLKKIANYLEVTIDYLLTGEKIQPTENSFGDAGDKSDSDIRRIERARNRMSAKEKERMMKILSASFEDYFNDDYIDEDTDE